ncbi:MAG: esterase/lipase family protein [Pyrinomonadaceae bacterium]
MRKIRLIIILCLGLCPAIALCQTTGKPPVIIIPGISGSELVDPKTKAKAWFSIKRYKADDLRLPMTSASLARNRDTLKVGDIIREVELPVLPDVEVYKNLLEALKARGYTEATWDKPQASDVFYVFPYDWRRDNVETAHLLIRKITGAKAKLRKPQLKFDIIAHSMGGLVARYAAMYGLAQPPAANPRPNWSGAAHINKLMMFGTPNEGSFSAFETLVKGYPIIAERNLPFVDDLRPEDVFSTPAVFQLLPHNGTAKFLDGDLKPITIDIYDPTNWIKYGWAPLADPKFLSKLRDAAALARSNKKVKPERPKPDAPLDDRILANTTSAQVRAYLATALRRAKLFHAAVDAQSEKIPVQLFAYGGNCKPTLSAVVLVRNDKKDEWETLFEPRSIKNNGGSETKKEQVQAVMFAPGDGRVTQNSLLADSAINKIYTPTASFMACGSHTKLFLEKPIQDSFLSALIVERKEQP